MNEILSFFSTVRWQDYVDITLNSYILLRLYVLFRGTHVFRVLIGIALLWFSQRIAVSLGLILTSWAMQGITALAAFIIIVVFRNEIRSVLQAKTLKAILWGFPQKPVTTPISIIAQSAFELAQRHCGALIILPGMEDITDVVHSGIPWNGLVSKEMIASIFWHDNPVHDGAVIIQGDQVVEVGVILPLSHSKDLPSDYGTRHRAAAGLAEATDALVVLVSEERGKVLVAKGPDMHVINQKAALEQVLQEHLGLTSEELAYPRKGKVRFGIAALVSVMFITGVWFSFTRGLYTLITLEIPIEYMNSDPGIEIIDTSLTAVRLDLSGSGALIRSIQPEQVKVRLDLSKGVIGHNTFNIKPENVSLPPGIFLKAVKPPVVEVTLDVPIRKELPVQVDWVGKLPKHVIVSEAILYPETVEVIGGNRILEKISTMYTEKVPVDNLTSTGTITVGLALNPASLKIAPDSKDRITVKYVVRKKVQ